MSNNHKAAPKFSLLDTSKKQVSLEDYQGQKNVVLLFFPLAFSSVCTQELCSTRDNLKIYDALNAEVIGISIDSFHTLRAFKEAHNLNFKLLSDFNKNVSEEYGVLYDDFFGMEGVSKRALFVIDKDGMIAHSEVLDNAGELPDIEKAHRVISSLN